MAAGSGSAIARAQGYINRRWAPHLEGRKLFEVTRDDLNEFGLASTGQNNPYLLF